MKNCFTLIISTILFLIVAVAPLSVSFAAGNTSNDSNPGQVRTTSKDGTVYLTTIVNGNSNNPSTISPTNSTPPASDTFSLTGASLRQPIGFADDLGSYLNSILSITMVVCLLLVFYYFISAGFQWITSGGDKGKTEEARNKIVNAVVGIIIVASSFALVGFVAYVLGFGSFNEALTNVKQINPS